MPNTWKAILFVLFIEWLCKYSEGYGLFQNEHLPDENFWRRDVGIGQDQVNGAYEKSVSVTGRVFVTMLGYPAQCEQKGLSHPCTLAFACWLVGGISHSGCGTSPWLVSCCVTDVKSKKKQNLNGDIVSSADFNSDKNQVDRESNFNIVGFQGDNLLPVRIVQRRNHNGDDIEAEPTCGISADRILSKRIIGGRQAYFGQFPWQAYIKIKSFQCGGVLVSRRFVATAAHCIYSAKLTKILVYLGELDTQDTGKVDELAPAELHRVKKKLLHPKFQYRATQPDRYDLALLELVTEAGYKFHISPICLPEKDVNLIGREAVVAGWGKVSPHSKLMGTNILRSVTVPISDIKECMAWHKARQITVELHEEMMCAGHKTGRRDACLGDSGGPLIILENGRWTLVGITSAGFGCGESHQPGIYHKIPVTVSWIRRNIEELE